jgi:protein gp37
MSDRSAIEWTDATWNPVTGCTEVSPGCDHCYARVFSERFRDVAGHPFENGFDLTLRAERLEAPLHWRRPRRVFVNSMSDLFHKDVPDEFIEKVFATMARANWHIFQVLTKRSRRLMLLSQRLPQAPHIWLGVSIESNAYGWRADQLRQARASVRFISAEPLLGSLSDVCLDGIDWVITGGESGHGARQCDPEWVRELRDRCTVAEIAFFHKQWGGRTPKAGGRFLDGRTWDEYPRALSADAEAPLAGLFRMAL